MVRIIQQATAILVVLCVLFAQWLGGLTVFRDVASRAPVQACAQRACCCPADMMAHKACCCCQHSGTTASGVAGLVGQLIRSANCAGKGAPEAFSISKLDWSVVRVDEPIQAAGLDSPVAVRATQFSLRTLEPSVPPPKFLLAA